MLTQTLNKLSANTVSVQSVDSHGVTFRRGTGKEKETIQLAWKDVYDLAGTTNGWGGPKYPHMFPNGPIANLAREAMKQARQLKMRIITVSDHPLNQVNVETVSGEYVGQEMGVDWAHTQHAFQAQAEKEAADLQALYTKKGYEVVRK